MIKLRKAMERGHARHGWLDSFHTFSFAEYHDPAHMGFRGLRVINEDRVQPGRGFGAHSHRNMEIVSYVLEGALQHKDSLGTGSVINPGDVQRMSAGRGVQHSEFNASRSEPVHFLQIWIVPNQHDIPASYEQKTFSDDDKKGRLCLVASQDGRAGSLTLHADVSLYASLLEAGQTIAAPLQKDRHAWLQLVRGALTVNGEALSEGDGLAVSDEAALALQGAEGGAELLLFDLA